MKYEVSVTVTIDKTVFVDAEDSVEAKELAEEKVGRMMSDIADITGIDAWDAYKEV